MTVGERARNAGWRLVDGRPTQVNSDGNVVTRDVAAWVAMDGGRNAVAYRTEAISAKDRQAFRNNLDAIARGDVNVNGE